MSYDGLLTFVLICFVLFFVNLEQCEAFGILWVGCECCEGPLLEGCTQCLWDLLWVFNKNPCRRRIAPVEALLQFHKDKQWTGLSRGR